jgi:hypothetical protein
MASCKGLKELNAISILVRVLSRRDPPIDFRILFGQLVKILRKVIKAHFLIRQNSAFETKNLKTIFCERPSLV